MQNKVLNCIYIYIFFQRNKSTTYIISTTLSFTYLLYDLQVNIDITLIVTDNILTMLP